MNEIKKSSGVTLIEILITVGILTVMAVVGVLSLTNYRERHKLDLESRELATILRDVQNRSLSQESGQPWGIRFINATSGTYTYQIFSGQSYASGTMVEAQALSTNIRFTEPYPSSTYDILFPALTGRPSESKIISFVTGANNFLVGDAIVNKSGMVNSHLETGLVGYWHFDEGTSTIAYDASGNGNNGTLTNGPTWQSGSSCKAGKCLSFDGSNDYVDAGNNASLQITGSLTVSAWVYRNDATQGMFVQKDSQNSGNRSHFLDVESDGTMKFAVFGNGSDSSYAARKSSITAATGQWYHIVGVYTSGVAPALDLYINGAERNGDLVLNAGIIPSSIYNTPVSLRIGAENHGSWPYYLNGLIDDVRIYNRALSATEISALYNDLK